MSNFKIHFQEAGLRYTIRQGHRQSAYHDALTSVTFSLAQGERLGLIGVNGAGKSTLLRLIAKVLYPTSGQIIREGRPRVAFLSLASSLYPDLSGRENALLGCMMGGLRRKEAESRIEAIAEFTELGEWLERPIRTYSTGMSARLSLAAALQTRPDLLLLDETLSVGDARFQKKAQAAVMETVSQAQSIVLVSHDSASIEAMCDRVVWLENGTVKADGPASEIVALYRNWVAQRAA